MALAFSGGPPCQQAHALIRRPDCALIHRYCPRRLSSASSFSITSGNGASNSIRSRVIG